MLLRRVHHGKVSAGECETRRKYVGKLIGTYNRKFVQIFEKTLSGIFGKDGSRVDKLDFASFATSMNAVLKKLSELIGQLGEGHQKLSAFSEWLDEYNSNDVKDLKDLIEIPGQYKRNIEPCPERHVKMASVNKTILILGSIRRPKRIEVHGTNEKSYYMLVKGGEDLRLDERIQQLFSLMNEIFVTDTDCKSRSIRIKQFNVTPMTNRLGIAKWVNNTIPLKQLIQKVCYFYLTPIATGRTRNPGHPQKSGPCRTSKMDEPDLSQ